MCRNCMGHVRNLGACDQRKVAVPLGSVSPISPSNEMHRSRTSLTRCVICGRKATAIRSAMVGFSCRGGWRFNSHFTSQIWYIIGIYLFYTPLSEGKNFDAKVQRTYRKEKHKNYLIVSRFSNAWLISAYPMISFLAKHSRSFTGVSLAGGWMLMKRLNSSPRVNA